MARLRPAAALLAVVVGAGCAARRSEPKRQPGPGDGAPTGAANVQHVAERLGGLLKSYRRVAA